jgi:hypothetical protein
MVPTQDIKRPSRALYGPLRAYIEETEYKS